MKKLIAMALFFVSAMTMSAQSVSIIDNNKIKDTDIIAALEDPNYALVGFDDPALKAAVDEINEQVKALTLDRDGALDALQDAIIELEMKAGDVDLNGAFELDDCQWQFDQYMNGGGFDTDGNGDVDLDDVQALFEKFMNS